MKRIDALTDEQQARIPEWVERWTAIGLQTGDADWERFERGARAAYQFAGLEPPKRVVHVSSPLVLALAAPIADHLLMRDDAVRVAVRDAVDVAVGGAVGDAVRDAVDDAVRGAVGEYIRNNWYRYIGGQFWVGGWWYGSSAVASYFRDVCGLELPDDIPQRATAYEETAFSACWWWPHREFVMVSDRPTVINRDAQGRLHCETGMAISWPDGWGVWAWHGVRVTEDIIMHPERITGAAVLAETNSAVRGVMIARKPLVLAEMAGATTLHEDSIDLDPLVPPPGILPRLAREIEEYAQTHPRPERMTRRLIQVPMPDHEDGWIKAIIFEDPAESGAMGVLLAHRNSKTCQDAIARSYSLTITEYPAELERLRR